MSKLNKIRLAFENTEAVDINKKDIAVICLSGITTEINWIYAVDEFYKTYQCELFHLQLKPQANKKIEELFDQEMLFERILKHNDIVSVTFYFEDEKQEEYYVKWDNSNEYTNLYQSSKILDNGNLLVNCSPAENLKE